MSEADKDGRMAQWVSDQLSCLGMEISEGVHAAIEKLKQMRECPECGNTEGMGHDPWDGWSCGICHWEENPL